MRRKISRASRLRRGRLPSTDRDSGRTIAKQTKSSRLTAERFASDDPHARIAACGAARTLRRSIRPRIRDPALGRDPRARRRGRAIRLAGQSAGRAAGGVYSSARSFGWTRFRRRFARCRGQPRTRRQYPPARERGAARPRERSARSLVGAAATNRHAVVARGEASRTSPFASSRSGRDRLSLRSAGRVLSQLSRSRDGLFVRILGRRRRLARRRAIGQGRLCLTQAAIAPRRTSARHWLRLGCTRHPRGEARSAGARCHAEPSAARRGAAANRSGRRRGVCARRVTRLP